MRKIMIAGGGIAGVSAAKEARGISPDAEITIVSAENHLPYYRLSLTRYLAGELPKENLPIYPESWYLQNRINLIRGKSVTGIDRQNKSVALDDGVMLPYDTLILSTGASPAVPPIPGAALAGVLTLRTLDDADLILDRMITVKSCVCIGGGILGLETAAAIVKAGVPVTLVEVAEWLMPRQLNKKASGYLKRFMQSLGIEVMENARIKGITGNDRCEGVQLEDGRAISAEMIVITAGIRPNTELPKESGLSAGKGLTVDASMRTADDSIYGAGDLVEVNGFMGGLWNISQLQGKVAGANAAGNEMRFEGVPKNHNLKVMGMEIFSMGDIGTGDSALQPAEKEEEGRYCLFMTRDGKIAGSIIIGDRSLSSKVKQAIEKGTEFPAEAAKDADLLIEALNRR